MTFLALQPLALELLPAALELDQRCFGGLWTLDGYQREVESPNSELLVLIEETEGGRQEAECSGEATIHSKLKTQNISYPSGSQSYEDASRFLNAEGYTKLKTQNSPSPLSSPLTPHPSPLLGLGCYWAILEEAHITMLAIDPAYQRQGLGQALLYALMASAHARGLERATLEVRISNHSALALYQKFDFREAGRRRRYYPDNQEDALVLWRGGIQTPEFSERLRSWKQQVCDRLNTANWQPGLNFEPSSKVSQCRRD